jgi:DnaJ like chaperone protein
MIWQKITEALGLAEDGAARTTLQLIWNTLIGSGDKFRAEESVAFTIAVVTLAAKMAKADGLALPIEATAFEQLYKIPESERHNVRKLYDLATKDTAGFEYHSENVAKLLAADPEKLRWVLECLFHVATADGILHPQEDRFLSAVARIFKIADEEFQTIRSGFVSDPESPYTILGVSPDISEQALKAVYKKLVFENHPDRMIASGMPPDFRAAADRRLQAINAAYDEIQRIRGWKVSQEPEKVT